MGGVALGSLAAAAVIATVPVGVIQGADKAPARSSCLNTLAGGKPVRFAASDGVRLFGRVAGRGTVGVVLGNPWTTTQCEWLDFDLRFVKLLLSSGFRVLLFDYRGTGGSHAATGAAADRYDADVLGAVAELRKRGAKKVVLVGGSLSGIIMLATAAELRPNPAAIVSLSGSGFAGTNTGKGYGSLDGRAAVKRLRVPLLFVAAKGDAEALADARILFKAAVTSDKQLVVISGSAHATAMLYDSAPGAGALGTRIIAFIRQHSG